MKKKVTTTKRKSHDGLDPQDWDFHEINPWEVRFATRHEYARECREKMEHLAQWMTPEWYALEDKGMAVKIAAEKENDMAALRKCFADDEWVQAHLLTRNLEKNGFAVPLIYAMTQSLAWGLDWRQTWLKQRSGVMEDVKAADSHLKNPMCVFVEKYPPSYKNEFPQLIFTAHGQAPTESSHEQRHWWDGGQNVSRYVLHINWDLVKRAANSKGYLVKSISEALQQEWKSQPNRRMGRQAADPFPKLRALAAWRLNEAGFSHDEARKLIRKRARELGLPYNSRKKIGGFPDFSDPKHWREAISEAEKELQRLRV